MKIKNRILATFGALALATGAFAAAEQAREHRAHNRGGHFLDRAATQLDLTDAQKQFAQSLFRENREAARPLMQQLREGREQMAAAVKANNDAEITRIANQQAQLTAQLHALQAKSLAKFYAQLTPEQKVKADGMYNNLQKRFGKRFGNRAEKRG
jgi:Spy/CpxP family protein refolding chaperone